jgi:hypothetical protein
VINISTPFWRAIGSKFDFHYLENDQNCQSTDQQVLDPYTYLENGKPLAVSVGDQQINAVLESYWFKI